MINKIALVLALIGGLNWGLMGVFNFNLVSFIFGGQASIASRIIYTIIGICSIICISFFIDEKNEKSPDLKKENYNQVD